MGKFKDLTGQRFGRLTVIKRGENYITPHSGKPRARWICQCDCGNESLVLGEALTRHLVVSCGCFQKEKASAQFTTHGQTNSRLYNVWCAMKRRCYNPNVKEFPLYGGRGITMCDEWKNDYTSFAQWALSHGYDENAPRGQCTIDRIDTNGNYEPNNCRFITQQEQMNNVRYNHYLEYNNEVHTIAEWGRILNISAEKITNRINKLGWTPERALTTT